MNVLGQKYGLSSQEIMKDIETALAGVVKPRQLRSILPLELKRKYNGNGKTAATAKLSYPNAAKPFQFSGKIVRYSRGRHCIVISDKIDTKKFEGLPLKVCITIDG
ncbi:MAG: hypothetical protein WCF23_09605 [Candidatus Nitrosopolaris sp.]